MVAINRRQRAAAGAEEPNAASAVGEVGANLEYRAGSDTRRRRSHTRIKFGPKWLVPPIVAVTSPDGIRDVLGRTDASSERCIIHEEVRNMAGDSLFVLPT